MHPQAGLSRTQPQRRRRHLLAALGALAALVVVLLPGPASAAGDPSPDPVPRPAAGRPWFGPGLDLDSDGPRSYAARLGATPSLYTVPVRYPVDAGAEADLRADVVAAATQGAVVVVDVEPAESLTDLTTADADRLAGLVAALHRELDTYFLVRFAPEMNGSWVTWGQQPQAYVAAFRTVAARLHAATRQAAMVWAPAYGSGYPFGSSYGAVDPSGLRIPAQLDTDGDGRVTERDDPYGPYYPGDAAVDWVGLSLYRFGRSHQDTGSAATNTVPAADEVRSRLAETWGYDDRRARSSFYDRFAAGHHRPMLLETSALHQQGGGASDRAVKQAWWRQVLGALPTHPMVRAISWLELSRPEPEIAGATADWRATSTPAMAHALRADLSRARVALGPVTRRLDQTTANNATQQARLPAAADLGDSMGWVVLCAAVLALMFLTAPLVGRLAPRWRYADDGGSRDLRIDLFRGVLICTVVITHTELAGPYSYLVLNGFGAISGAEGFVMLSGVVLGMVHAAQSERLGEWATALLRWRRARKIYLVALVVTLLVYVLGTVPGIDASVITTFTDRGTGAAGAGARGQVYDLYANAQHLFDYPPPWFAVHELLTLDIGPWVINILGLFVVMTALVPLLGWLLRRRLWWLVLLLSWAGYAYGTATDVHWLPSQFEDVFPLLIWQVPFVHGLVLGYHRRRVVAALTGTVGKICCGVLVAAYAGTLVVLWLLHGPAYDGLYHRFYIRVDLQAGRLVDLALVAVAAFAFLTAWWQPVNRAAGRFLIPLGQASLYVFIVHAFLVLAIAQVPGLDRQSAWQGALLHTAELAVAWLLVRRRVLFSVIPR